MPIPLLVSGGVFVVTSIYSSYKACNAYNKQQKAKEIVSLAEKQQNTYVRMHQTRTASLQNEVSHYSYLLRNDGIKCIKSFKEKAQRLEQKMKSKNNQVSEIQYTFQSPEFKKMETQLLTFDEIFNASLKTGKIAWSTGSLTLGLIGEFGVASTGTAISSLSGIAAKNATLAYLGGGTLASGGGGVAAGTVVLGGVIAMPIMLIGSCIYDSYAEKSLTNAHQFRARCEVSIEQIKTQIVMINGFESYFSNLNLIIKSLIDLTNKTIDQIDIEQFNPQDKVSVQAFQKAYILTKMISQILEHNPIKPDGSLDQNSLNLSQIKKLLH